MPWGPHYFPGVLDTIIVVAVVLFLVYATREQP